MYGRFEAPNGKLINEIINTSCLPINTGSESFLELKFGKSRSFDYGEQGSIISVINCYGDATINNILFKRIDCPNFFTVTSDIPDFLIRMPYKKIKEVEDARRNKDIEIRLDLNVLFTIHPSNYFSGEKIYHNKVALFAKISKSDWIESFLPNWGFFNKNEILISYDNLGKQNQVMELISNCRKSFSEEKYEEVLRIGYTLLESLPKLYGYKDVKEMFVQLKESNDELIKYKYKCLDQIFSGLKSLPHPSRHGTVQNEKIIHDQIEKADAKFFLYSIELLIDYILNDDIRKRL